MVTIRGMRIEREKVSTELDPDVMEMLEELRQGLDLIEAYWWFVENSVEGFCCSNTLGAKKQFEKKHAPAVFELISLLHKRKEQNGRRNTGR